MLAENHVPTVPIRYTYTLVVSCDLGSFTHFGPYLAVSLCLVTVQPVGKLAWRAHDKNTTGALSKCSHPPLLLSTDFHIQTYIHTVTSAPIQYISWIVARTIFSLLRFALATPELTAVCTSYMTCGCLTQRKALRRMMMHYWRSDWVLAL